MDKQPLFMYDPKLIDPKILAGCPGEPTITHFHIGPPIRVGEVFVFSEGRKFCVRRVRSCTSLQVISLRHPLAWFLIARRRVSDRLFACLKTVKKCLTHLLPQ